MAEAMTQLATAPAHAWKQPHANEQAANDPNKFKMHAMTHPSHDEWMSFLYGNSIPGKTRPIPQTLGRLRGMQNGGRRLAQRRDRTRRVQADFASAPKSYDVWAAL
jgi:hypothetical protein